MNDIVNFLNQSEEPTDLQIALRSADTGEDGDAGHWPTVAAVLAAEYRKVHSALVRLDGVCRHEFGNHGFRPDWLREAIAGEHQWEREHVMDVGRPTSESQREAAGTADEKPDGQAENARAMTPATESDHGK